MLCDYVLTLVNKSHNYSHFLRLQTFEISHRRHHHASPSFFSFFFSSSSINTTYHSFHIFSSFNIHFFKFYNINFLPYFFPYKSILTPLKMKTLSIFTFPLLSLFFIAIFHMVQAQNIDISPAPTPTSDGKQIIFFSFFFSFLLIYELRKLFIIFLVFEINYYFYL